MIIDFVVMKAILPKSILISSKIQLQYNDVWKMSKRMEEYFRLYNHVHKPGSLMFVMTTIQLLEVVEVGIFVFRGGGCGPFWKVINIFACTCPNRSGAGAIDNPDRFEQVLDPYYILEVPEKIFTHNISMIRRQKMVIFGVLNVFISNCTYYNLY